MRTALDATQEIPLGETCPGCESEVVVVTAAGGLLEVRCACGTAQALA